MKKKLIQLLRRTSVCMCVCVFIDHMSDATVRKNAKHGDTQQNKTKTNAKRLQTKTKIGVERGNRETQNRNYVK